MNIQIELAEDKSIDFSINYFSIDLWKTSSALSLYFDTEKEAKLVSKRLKDIGINNNVYSEIICAYISTNVDDAYYPSISVTK